MKRIILKLILKGDKEIDHHKQRYHVFQNSDNHQPYNITENMTTVNSKEAYVG